MYLNNHYLNKTKSVYNFLLFNECTACVVIRIVVVLNMKSMNLLPYILME